jgi:hypothetical protein
MNSVCFAMEGHYNMDDNVVRKVLEYRGAAYCPTVQELEAALLRILRRRAEYFKAIARRDRGLWGDIDLPDDIIYELLDSLCDPVIGCFMVINMLKASWWVRMDCYYRNKFLWPIDYGPYQYTDVTNSGKPIPITYSEVNGDIDAFFKWQRSPGTHLMDHLMASRSHTGHAVQLTLQAAMQVRLNNPTILVRMVVDAWKKGGYDTMPNRTETLVAMTEIFTNISASWLSRSKLNMCFSICDGQKQLERNVMGSRIGAYVINSLDISA